MSELNSRKVLQTADYIRYLSLICIEKAQSGHPGLPLGCANLGVVLYRYFLRHCPATPDWMNRDRFVLSAGHGSMLLYSLLHVSGFDMSLDDLNRFRQWKSHTPGHPELQITRGIETTTGPLGQGFANAVGMAIASKWRAERYNRPGYDLFNYRIYVLVGDGCLMEGISYEAASLAGHLGLDNLVTIYDSNHISIDGNTDITFTEDVAARFRAQGWEVAFADGENPEDFATTLEALIQTGAKPKLLIANTVIGSGLKEKRDTNAIHGAPAGRDEILYFLRHSATKSMLSMTGMDPDHHDLAGWLNDHLQPESPLLDNPDAREFMNEASPEQNRLYENWLALWSRYQEEYPEAALEIKNNHTPGIPHDLDQALRGYAEQSPDATRNVSGRVLNLCAGGVPALIGGSADLAGSTKAVIKGSSTLAPGDFSGRNLAYGIREHAMGAVGNGIALDGGNIAFSGTFFSFMDYMKPAVRLAALMKLRHLFLYSHDSIYLGEDGPTHQPIEHLNSLRLIPGLTTFRPANDRETALAFRYFLESDRGPVAIVTTRQKINPQGWRSAKEVTWEQFGLGAYEFQSPTGKSSFDMILLASGSELGSAAAAARNLEKNDHISARVISVPCLELFSRAPQAYRRELLGDFSVPVFLVEAASFRGIDSWFHPDIQRIDIQRFGSSAPGGELGDRFGFSPEAIRNAVLDFFKQNNH